MFIVGSYSLAIIFCVITMLCWGSWANAQKWMKPNWVFTLFYWDYSIGVLLFALLFALTMGSFGSEGVSFISNLMQGSSQHFLSAFFGGVIFNLSNILLVAAIAIAGMAVAFPVAVGLALVIGVVTNYIATPAGDPLLLFSGVFGIVIAIIVTAVAYSRVGSSSGNTVKGLLISIVSGVLMGFFYRFIAASMSLNFIHPESTFYTPYTAVFVFALGLFCSSFVFNTLFMKKPLVGEKVRFPDYVARGDSKTHILGIIGGALWVMGTLFSLIASGKAGFAISYGLGQGATLVAAFWGVFIWREFRAAPKGTNKLLGVMFAFYLLGLVLLVLAKA